MTRCVVRSRRRRTTWSPTGLSKSVEPSVRIPDPSLWPNDFLSHRTGKCGSPESSCFAKPLDSGILVGLLDMEHQ
jgi:hypothetical protein